jgi:NDP-sugar pyrophosphorylase family protein
MTVYVLAGGLGTRIAGLYPDRPKALVPVAAATWQIPTVTGRAT